MPKTPHSSRSVSPSRSKSNSGFAAAITSSSIWVGLAAEIRLVVGRRRVLIALAALRSLNQLVETLRFVLLVAFLVTGRGLRLATAGLHRGWLCGGHLVGKDRRIG